jgi:signal transduction histidine kinase
MRWPILSTVVETEEDIVAVRQRARRLADGLGFGVQDQVRIATALSEIARNAFGYAGGGRVEYGVDGAGAAQSLVIRISDRGPGIADLAAVLEGRFRSEGGLGLGIAGARRLVDDFTIMSQPGRGTVATLSKRLPPGSPAFSGARASALAQTVGRAGAEAPMLALRTQHRELLQSLAALSEREEEAQRLNRELAETNRGVVALYAELEFHAEQLSAAGMTLESQVAARTEELARANERLRAEAAERERVEHDLRQSQKMEAVGQLTGGIAHDFNNLLTGIVGSLDLMRSRIALGRTEDLDRYIKGAMASAQRAAALTHRLLAFARRQPLDPRPTDANALLAGMQDLLRRTISEAISLDIVEAHCLWATLCDPHQLENAILNLAINARDAMPDGGTLTIATSNCPMPDPAADAAGPDRPYVCIRVSDTGTGMSADVASRAFDPFFTTKQLGQGTGLGLSMIYGFARQSGGEARIESELGRGTTVSLYLPRHDGSAEAEVAEAGKAVPARGAGESVLVVEDEPVVRDLIVEVLHELGYRVLQARDGPSGLAVLRSPERVDLLVTDVGLPGMNGRDLADAARGTRPALKVLFITGYAETGSATFGSLDPGTAMMTKPFSTDALMARVRGLIEGR